MRMQRVGGWKEQEEECDFSCLHTIHQDQLCALLFHFLCGHPDAEGRVGQWEGEGEEKEE